MVMVGLPFRTRTSTCRTVCWGSRASPLPHGGQLRCDRSCTWSDPRSCKKCKHQGTFQNKITGKLAPPQPRIDNQNSWQIFCKENSHSMTFQLMGPDVDGTNLYGNLWNNSQFILAKQSINRSDWTSWLKSLISIKTPHKPSAVLHSIHTPSLEQWKRKCWSTSWRKANTLSSAVADTIGFRRTPHKRQQFWNDKKGYSDHTRQQNRKGNGKRELADQVDLLVDSPVCWSCALSRVTESSGEPIP